MKKQDGVKPLFGRTPKRAEWQLLEVVALELKDHIDSNDLKVIRDIAQKGDMERYQSLDDYWGLHSINSLVQPVGTRDACLYQLSSLLKKTQWDDTLSPLQIDNAKITFDGYEREMREYNRRGYSALSFSDDPLVNTWLTRMRHWIRSVLGPLDFDDVQRYAKHGPGGTFGLSSQMGHRYYKYATIPYEVTSSSVHMARRLILKDERWKRAVIKRLVIQKLIWHPCNFREESVYCSSNSNCFRSIPLPRNTDLFRVVPGNRIEFVHKKQDEARTIALEPAMNVLLQLGVDGHIRKRLKKFGIDINDQSINQKLAQVGSITNLLSTLDLKGASDKISMHLIENIFPYEWVEYFYLLRSDVGFFPDGSQVRYEKLSSMGNGFTFAVETLIFAACVFAVAPEVKFSENAHVYGDDIICPTSSVQELTRLLLLCGFSINVEKSFFLENNVRESCGADFHNGQNIRPVFLRHNLERMDVFAFYSFHNRLKEWFSRISYVEDPHAAQLLRKWCSDRWLLYGPPDLEDQSSYLAISEPNYGRSSGGSYPHDRAIAVVQKYRHNPLDEWFVVLCNSLDPLPEVGWVSDDVATSAGSQFDITKRGRYKIRTRLRRGCALAWPRQHHAL